jgi:hypothetical protein
MQNYILKLLKLSNSNFLDDLEIEFECKFTLIQGPNGSGKTSLYTAMRTGKWIYKGQTGQLELQYRQKSLDAELHDLIYIGESWRKLDQNHQYQKYFVKEDFFKQFLENLNAAQIAPYELNIADKATSIGPLFFHVQQLPNGSQFIWQLLLLKTLREYIGINGALILHDSIWGILDIPTRQLAIEILNSMSEQIVIFEGNWWSEVHKEFSFDNLNIIQLQAKQI